MAIERGLMAAGLVVAVCVLASCDDKTDASVETVRIGGRAFHLELALDNATRMKGLGGREHIEKDGGMLFAFRSAQPLNFVMRDCPIPIDILFLDGSGRVVATYTMLPEEPRRQGESESQYEGRLKRYESRFASQFVVELAGHTLDGLKVKEGDKVEFDLEGVKKRAR